MEKNPMAMLNQSKLSSSILWQALRILSTNYRPLLSMMLLYLLFSSSLLALSIYLSITPTLSEFTGFIASLSFSHPKSPEHDRIISPVRKDLTEITTIEAIFLVTTFTTSSLITMTSINMISIACTLTQLFATVLHLIGVFFILVRISAFIFISIGSTAYTLGVFLLSILASLLYLYLALICSLIIVVSVVDKEGCFWLSALGRSVKLTKGMMNIGILMLLVNTVVSSIIITVYSFSMIRAPENFLFGLVFGFVYVALQLMMIFFVLPVNTLYYECKDYGRDQLLGVDSGSFASNLSTEADAAIP